MSEQLFKEILEGQQFIIKTLQYHSVQLEELQKGQLSHSDQLEELQKGQLNHSVQLEELQKGQLNHSVQLDELQKGQLNHSVQLDELQKGQLRLETRIESEVIDKIRGLYDFREAQNNVNNKTLAALERIEDKIESHDIQIHILDKNKSNKRKVK